MDLLPKSSEEFSSQSYWDAFFSKRKEDPFEWYGEYPELSSLIHKYISPKDNALIVGCGNSSLSWDLYNAGIKNQTSLDISSVVVNQMKAKYPLVDFVEGDVTNMTFPENNFSCILDKGTFDALSPPPNIKKNRNKTEEIDAEEEKVKVDLMIAEISRVLKPGGRFICISLLQPHVASRLITYFHGLRWMTRVVRCLDAEQKTAEKASDEKSVVFPVFMTIFTKLNLPLGTNPILEAGSPSNASSITRYASLEELLNYIKDQQNFALIKRGLTQLGFCAKDVVQLKLSNALTGEDRYILNLVDVPKLLNNPIKQRFGVFIVPQGRETEWLFGSHEGRVVLAIQANFTRLVVVHLVRGQVYKDMNAVQDEIKGPLASLSPLCVTEKNIKAPIMTLGNDVGNRTIVHEGNSTFSGDFLVEDVYCDGKVFRRLIFLNSPNIIQSEAEVVVVKKRGKEFHNPITSKLTCQHHGLMTLSFGFLNYFFNEPEVEPAPVTALLIGLGGGLLASFLINFMPHLALSVVEIDPEIVKVAKNHFGLVELKEKLVVFVDDGLKFIQSTDSQYNLILVDVDNKSTKEGLSCPPPDFLEVSNLNNFKKIMSSNRSILLINLVCRNEELKKGYVTLIQQQFPFILSCDVPNEVNSLLFCFLKAPDDERFNLKNLFPHISSSIKVTISNNLKPKLEKKSNTAKLKIIDKKIIEKPQVDLFDGVFDNVELLASSFKVFKL